MAVMRVYGRFLENLLRARIYDLNSSGTEVSVYLLGDGYTFDENHDNWAQIVQHEVDDDIYPDYGGPEEILNKVVAYDTGPHEVSLDGDDVEFTPEGNIAANYAVIVDTTDPANVDQRLIACVDFEGEEESVDGRFEIRWHGDGIIVGGVNPS